MTIPLPHLTNSYNVTQTEWDALVDAINNLYGTVMNIGGSVGAAAINSNIGGQLSSGSTSANGRVTVTHGLGWQPDVVIPAMAGSVPPGPYGAYIISPTPTVFTVQFYVLATGAAAASGQSVSFYWAAFKGI